MDYVEHRMGLVWWRDVCRHVTTTRLVEPLCLYYIAAGGARLYLVDKNGATGDAFTYDFWNSDYVTRVQFFSTSNNVEPGYVKIGSHSYSSGTFPTNPPVERGEFQYARRCLSDLQQPTRKEAFAQLERLLVVDWRQRVLAHLVPHLQHTADVPEAVLLYL